MDQLFSISYVFEIIDVNQNSEVHIFIQVREREYAKIIE